MSADFKPPKRMPSRHSHLERLVGAQRAVTYACSRLAHMSRSDGLFAFQRLRRYRDSRTFFRWDNAHMLLGLADLISSTGPTPSSLSP